MTKSRERQRFEAMPLDHVRELAYGHRHIWPGQGRRGPKYENCSVCHESRYAITRAKEHVKRMAPGRTFWPRAQWETSSPEIP